MDILDLIIFGAFANIFLIAYLLPIAVIIINITIFILYIWVGLKDTGNFRKLFRWWLKRKIKKYIEYDKYIYEKFCEDLINEKVLEKI